jgi:titin
MSQSKFFEPLENRQLLAGTPLPAPTNLGATVRSSTSVRLFWDDNASTESGYKIERSTNGKDFTQLNVLPPNTSSYINGRLRPYKKYYYRVRAFDASSHSGYTNIKRAIPQPIPSSDPLAVPTNFKAASASSTSIKLTWTDTASETGYKIERSTNGKDFTEINAVGPNVTTYTNGKLTLGKKYYYRLRAFDATRTSAYTAVVNATPTQPAVTPLAAPTGLLASVGSATSVNLVWNDTTSSELGFKIERSANGGAFVQVGTVGANVAAYTDSGLTTGTPYTYRVRAYNTAAGNSPYSNSSSATPVAPPLVEANELRTIALSTTAIRVMWKDNSLSETGYKVERSTSSSGGYSQIAKLAADSNYYNDSGLQSGKKYYYRVRPYNDSGNGPYSNSVGRTTPLPGAVPDWTVGGINDYATGNWYFDGVSVTLKADPLQVIPTLKALHVGSVRLWFTNDESWELKGGEGIAIAKQYHEAGFRVMMVIGHDTIPTLEQSTAFFNYVANYKDALKYVDLWEIGNEPNIWGFWRGTAEEYVNLVLKPAYEAFHPLGALVVGAGPTWDVNYAKKLVSYGYLNYVDYANFHPYGSTPEEVYTRAIGARDAFAGKPILFSEWNIRNTAGKDAWAAKVDATRKLLATVGADSAFYFTYAVANTMAGPAGLINLTDYSPNQPFYDMFKYWGEEKPPEPPVDPPVVP